MSQQQRRVAIISATGTARKRTIPAIRDQSLCEIVAISGRDEHKLATLAHEHNIPKYYLDHNRMLDDTCPDFVFLGSPPALHYEQLRACFDRHLPVLCEKPLCLSTTEAKRIVDLAHDIPVRVAHHLRHQPGIAALRQTLQARSLGPLRRASLQWGFWLNTDASNAAWKLDPAAGGPNAFFDAGIHAVDLLLYLFGRPQSLVALTTPSRFPRTSDNVSALALCGSAMVEMNASQSMRYPRNAITLDFEQGTVHAPYALSERAFTRIEVTSAEGNAVQSFSTVNPYAEEVRDFLRLLEGSPSCGTTLEEAFQGIELLEAIAESCSSGTFHSIS